MRLSKDAMQRRENIIEEFITAGGMFGILHTNIACLMQASPSKQLRSGGAAIAVWDRPKKTKTQGLSMISIYRSLPSLYADESVRRLT
jgi:hypothetical protein